MRPPHLQTGPDSAPAGSLTQREHTRSPKHQHGYGICTRAEKGQLLAAAQHRDGTRAGTGTGTGLVQELAGPLTNLHLLQQQAGRGGIQKRRASMGRLAPQWRQKVSCIWSGQGRPIARPRGGKGGVAQAPRSRRRIQRSCSSHGRKAFSFANREATLYSTQSATVLCRQPSNQTD